MKRLHLQQFILFIMIVGVWFPYAVNAEALQVGYLEFPPFTFTNDEKKPDGIFVNITEHILNTAQLSYNIKKYPPARLYSDVAKGDVHIWPGIKGVPAHKDTTLASESTVFKITLNVYSIGDKSPIQSKDDLKGKNIIVLRGYSYGGLIKFLEDPNNNIQIKGKVNSHESAFKMLTKQRADYVLDYKYPSDKVLKNLDIPRLTHTTISVLPAQWIVSKATPNAEDVVKILDTTYQQLLQDGTIDKIWAEN